MVEKRFFTCFPVLAPVAVDSVTFSSEVVTETTGLALPYT